jgi:hypothetical protein
MKTIIPSANLLLVEGATEKRLIPELMEHRGVSWIRDDQTFAVQIVHYGGISNMLAPGELETAAKTSRLEALGIIFDADGLHDDGTTRWASMRRRCADVGVDLPTTPPSDGYIGQTSAGTHFGVWMMPDNTDRGMLETFLLRLIPSEQDPLYAHALESVTKAKGLNAPFRVVHEHKAIIHSWLSWQDAPGAQLHEAVKFRLLDPNSTNADSFCRWFRQLYSL